MADLLPIWRDTYDFASTEDVIWRIEVNDAVIYNGHSFRAPNETTIFIKLNDICWDYLKSAYLSQPLASRGALPEFLVYFYDKNATTPDDMWEFQDNYTFYNDFSGIEGINPAQGLSAPTSVIDSNAVILYTTSASTASARITKANSSAQTINLPKVQNGTTYNADFARVAESSALTTYALDLRRYPDAVSVTIGAVRYEVAQLCARYALYYLNAFGGFDCLTLDGNTTRSDTIERSEIMHAGSNSSRRVSSGSIRKVLRGRENYTNDVTPTWVARTGWLSDEQSANMWHLFGSTDVYLYDFANATLTAVVLTDKEQTHKSFRANGGSLTCYDIAIEAAMKGVRR